MDLDIPILKKHLKPLQSVQLSMVCGMGRAQMTSLQSPAQPDPKVLSEKSLADLHGFLPRTIMYS